MHHNCTWCLTSDKLSLFLAEIGKWRKLSFIPLQNHANLQVRSAINQPTSASEYCLSSWLQVLKKIQMTLIFLLFAHSQKVKHFPKMAQYQWCSGRTQRQVWIFRRLSEGPAIPDAQLCNLRPLSDSSALLSHFTPREFLDLHFFWRFMEYFIANWKIKSCIISKTFLCISTQNWLQALKKVICI